MKANSLRRLLTRGLLLLILVIGVRSFFLLETTQPLVVEGGSMAPHYVGLHVVGHCPQCGLDVPLPAPQPSNDERPPIICLACRAELELGNRLPGDRLVMSPAKWFPQRWSAVVFQSPTALKELWIKRLVGLPGERIALRDGDVWINGQRAVKTLAQQKAVRVLVARESDGYQHWTAPEVENSWNWRTHGWHCGLAGEDSSAMLTFNHAITDDLAWNHQVSRQVNQVDDLMLEFALSLSDTAQLRIEMPGFLAVISAAKGIQLQGSPSKEAWPTAGEAHIVCSSFDGMATISVNGAVISLPDSTDTPGKGSLRLTLTGGTAMLEELSVWRDVYYEAPGSQSQETVLSDTELFVVGDNSPVSVDSRNWDAPAGLTVKAVVGVAR